MKNIEALLKDMEANFDQVVKSTIFLKDMNDFTTVNQIYGAYFRKDPPARSTVEVSHLPRNAKVEIEDIKGGRQAIIDSTQLSAPRSRRSPG